MKVSDTRLVAALDKELITQFPVLGSRVQRTLFKVYVALSQKEVNARPIFAPLCAGLCLFLKQNSVH